MYQDALLWIIMSRVALLEIRAATIRNVISNVEARSNKPANWREKSGFLGAVADMAHMGRDGSWIVVFLLAMQEIITSF